jgi:hypothetical protein
MAHEALLDQLKRSPLLAKILQNLNYYITKILIKKSVKGVSISFG